MSRAVIVIPVELDQIEGDVGLAVSLATQGFKLMYDKTGVQLNGPVSVTVDQDDMELIADVFQPAEIGAGKHVVVVTEDDPDRAEWSERHVVVEHSLRCRRSGRMAECKVLRLARVGVDAGHIGVGRHVAHLEAGALLWED